MSADAVRPGAQSERGRQGAMRIGLPGTWLAHVDLEPGVEPAGMEEGCGCQRPRIWDGQRGVWRHLEDGTPCIPTRLGQPTQ
jgi:hypothetical protein